MAAPSIYSQRSSTRICQDSSGKATQVPSMRIKYVFKTDTVNLLSLDRALRFANFYRAFAFLLMNTRSPIYIGLKRLRSKSPPGSKHRPMPNRQTQLSSRRSTRYRYIQRTENRLHLRTHIVSFNPTLNLRVELDISGFAVAAIQTVVPSSMMATYNTIYIQFRAKYYLEGSSYPVTIPSDHANLGYFMTTKKFNRRQA